MDYLRPLDAPPPRRLSEVLRAIAEAEEPSISLGRVVDELGDRAFAAVMVVAALPNLAPMPPGVSILFGTIILIAAIQLAVGMKALRLPAWSKRWTVRRDRFRRVVHKVSPVLEKVERLARPRFWWLSQRTVDGFVGTVGSLMGIALALPIPFANWGPTLAVLFLALGLLQRDGLWVLIGLTVAIASIGFIIGLIVSLGLLVSP